MIKSFLTIVLAALWSIVYSTPSRGADAVPNATAPAKIAHVGIFLNQIQEINLKENRFKVDFYIWFRWQGDMINPLDSFDVVGGEIESKQHAIERPLKDGVRYASCRVIAVVTKFWDVSRFPIDDHELEIVIEDSQNEEFKLSYVADAANCNVSPSVSVSGWKLSTHQILVRSEVYRTTYGDTDLPSDTESTYSRFIFSISMTRPGYGYCFKLFFGLFVATAVAVLALFIDPIDLDPRFGLGIGALFAAVASEYVVTSSLPDTNVMTLADQFHMVSLVFILLSLVESVISLKMYKGTQRNQELSRGLDRWCTLLLASAYVASLIAVSILCGRD